MLDWFKINSMKLFNPSKIQFMVVEAKNIVPFRRNVTGKIIPRSNEEVGGNNC